MTVDQAGLLVFLTGLLVPATFGILFFLDLILGELRKLNERESTPTEKEGEGQ